MQKISSRRLLLVLERYPQSAIFSLSLLFLLLSSWLISPELSSTRFVIFVENMQGMGVTIFPYINGSYYPDYLSLPTLLSYLSSLFVGKITLFSVMIPYCIAGAVTLLFTYKIAAFHNKLWGFYSVLWLLVAAKFTGGINSLSLDIYPMMVTVVAFYIVYVSERQQRSYLFFWLFPCLLFGFATRGPIGLIVPAAVVASYYFFLKKWRLFFSFTISSAVLLVIAVVAMLIAAYVVGGESFYHQVARMEMFERISANDHFPRLYFYISLGLLANFFPTAVVALIAILSYRKTWFSHHAQYVNFVIAMFALLMVFGLAMPDNSFFKHYAPIIPALMLLLLLWQSWRLFQQQMPPQQQLLLFLVWWFLAITFFLTIPDSKKARYLLPALPALSLLASYLFVDKSVVMQKIRQRIIQAIIYFPGVLLLLAIFVLFYNILFPQYALAIHSLATVVSFFILQLFSLGLRRYYYHGYGYQGAALFLLLGIIVIINALIIFPLSPVIS